MKLCNYCRVELDNDMIKCPLCGLAVGERDIIAHKSKTGRAVLQDKTFIDFENMSVAQKRKLFWEISGIILASGIIVTLILNVIINKSITWSKFTIVACLSLFANISFFTLFRNRPFLLLLGSFISNALLLILLNEISTGNGWGTKLGIPILISLYTLIIVVLWLIKISNQRGFNILAVIFMAVGVFLMCTEFFISLYKDPSIKLRWSIIAGVSIIPVSSLLFFVHYRLKKGTKLQRFFNV